jgi:uncharacterized protein with FMN-binding domain
MIFIYRDGTLPPQNQEGIEENMKNSFKASLACMMALLMLLACGCSSKTAAPAPKVSYTAGTYEATVNGHNAPITVSTTVTGDAITEVAVTKDNETIGVGKAGIDVMTKRIVEAQSLACDVVAGASITSRSILAAVEDCLTQAGGNVEALSAKPQKTPAKDEDYTADVVVVGGGGAGLAAAISAPERRNRCDCGKA